MTIYTSKGNDKKEEEAIFPQVVTDVLLSSFDNLSRRLFCKFGVLID